MISHIPILTQWDNRIKIFTQLNKRVNQSSLLIGLLGKLSFSELDI